jgi:hypothetical protein
MNKAKIISISEKIKKALSEISKSEGIELSLGSVSFTSSSFTSKITGIEKDNPEFDKANLVLSRRYGFTQNIVGMEFTSPSGTFLISGFKTSNRKYPILATRVTDGAPYKFHPNQILKYFGGHKIINRNANLKNLLD